MQLRSYKLDKFNISLWIVFIIEVIICLKRSFYGLDITDEAYYLADSVTSLYGNYPFSYNFSHASGMSIFMAPFVFIYSILVPSLKGFVLYMRLCFVIFRVAILYFSYLILKKTINKESILMGMIFALPFYGPIGQFSYNTISIWLTFFTGVLIYGAINERGNKKKAYGILAGIFEAFSVFAHPLSAFAIALFVVVILNKKDYKTLKYYILSGLSFAILVLFIIGIMSGFDHLINGLKLYLSVGSSGGNGTSYSLIDLIYEYRKIAFFYILSFVIFFAILHFKNKDLKKNIVIATTLTLLVSIVLCIFFYDETNYHFIDYLGLIVIIAAISILPVFYKRNEYWLLVAPPILFSLVEILLAKSSNPTDRMYFSLIAFFGIILLVYNKKYLKKIVLLLLCFILSLLQVSVNELYVYRDSNISELNTVVKNGVYKGIHTTEDRANDIQELEEYIKSITNEEEWIKFLDNAPFGYLFSNGKMCDIRTWDSMNYTYRKNNPIKLYRYFENRECIPDKLIYIDYGRDEQLSIEDDEWTFNDFVNANYDLSDEKQLNKTFRIKVFLKK